MNVLRLLFRVASRTLYLAAFVGLLSGVSSAALAALVGRRLATLSTLDVNFLVQFAGLLAVVAVLDYCAKILLVQLTTGINRELSLGICRRILATPLSKVEEIGSPRLLAALTEDLVTINSALSFGPTLITNSVILASCLVYLFWLSPLAFGVVGLFAAPGAAIQFFLDRRAKRRFHESYAYRHRIHELYRAITDGIKGLKLSRARRVAMWERLLLPMTLAFQETIVAARRFYAMASTLTQTVFFLFMLGLFSLAATIRLDPVVLTSFTVVALFMRSSMNTLINVIPMWSNAHVSLRKLEELGLSLEESAEKLRTTVDAPARKAAPQRITLELDGIQHSYRDFDRDNQFVLGPLSMTLTSGQIVFIIGANGSGKTTLMKLLTGLYLPERGEIRLNGKRIEFDDLDDFRQNFSAIFSDIYLFEQLLGFDEANLDTRAREYLLRLQLDHKLSVENGTLSTTKLSQGQRSRLALLVAFLEDCPIYIFDEWAATQDPVFKDVFYRQLLPELRNRGKLVVVISHDDHYFDVADRVIKLDYGQIEYDEVRRQPVRAHEAEPV